MVVVDPQFTEIPLKGVYLWESGRGYIPDPENHRLKTGVQLTPMDQVFKTFEGKGNVYLRRLKAPDGLITEDKLKIVHTAVHNKPYDMVPFDWLGGIISYDPEPQKNDRFWCSALVGYIYSHLGIIHPSIDWSILRPCDFSPEHENLSFVNHCDLDEEVIQLI